MPVTLQCGWCGDEFDVPPSRSDRSFCSRECYEANREDDLPLDEGELRRRYVEEKQSTYQIAEDVGRDPKSVHRWLERFDIPTRDRGDNLRGAGSDHWTNQDMENPFKGQRHSEETRDAIGEAMQGPTPALRGENNGMYGRTGADNPNWKGGVSPERQRFYSSHEWTEACRVVEEREDSTCQRCGRTRGEHGGQFMVHHIDLFDKENPQADPDRLALLCTECHYWVHSDENTDGEFLSD